MKVKESIGVDKDVIEALLSIARIGEAQSVAYSIDNGIMAGRAAALSKDICARSIEILLAVLTGEDVDLSNLPEED